MSMEDTHNLAIAVVTGQSIKLVQQRPAKTLIADVLSATLHCEHASGRFQGSVNYQIRGQQYVKIDVFYNMWMIGWEPND